MKKIWIGLLIAFVLLIGAAVAVPFLFKDKIIQAAKDATNKEMNAILNFESLDVSLLQNIKNFPDVSLIVHKPTLIGVDQFAGDTLIQMDKLLLSLDIKSVFQTAEPMAIHSVELYNASIFAKIAADSSKNWDIMKKKEDTSSSAFKLAINKILLDNVNIQYRDITANRFLDIKGLNHEANGNFSENIVAYKSQTKISDISYFTGLVPYLKNAKIENQSTINIDQLTNKISFDQNEISVNELKLILNGFVQTIDADAMSLKLDFKTENNEFKKILSLLPAIYKNNFSKIETNGSFDLNGKIEGLYRNSIYPKMDIVFNVKNGEFHYPRLPQRVSAIQIASTIKSAGGSLDNMRIDVSKFSMNLGKDPFQGKLILLNPMSNPYIELYAKGKINLADVQNFYPMEGVKKLSGLANVDIDIKAKKSDLQTKNYQAIKAIGNAQISNLLYESSSVEKPLNISNVLLNFSPQYVDVPNCSGTIGSTDFTLNARLDNFIGYYLSKDEVMTGKLDLKSKFVDMNEFSNDEKSSEYVMVPSKIDFQGKASIDQMKYGKMTIKNIAGNMGVKEEKITLQNVNAELLGGKAIMDAVYSTVGQTKPLTAVHYDIQSFDINEVYTYMESAPKLAPIMKYMTGKLSSNSNLTMNLLPDMSPDLNTLNGDFSVGIPFAKVVDVPALSQIVQLTKLSQLNNLEATNIKANMSFDKGRVILQPTKFKANDMDINIAGMQGLDKSLDYKMAVDVPFSKLGNASSVVNGLISKFNIPFIGNINPETIRLNINIKGFFDKPQVSLGAPEILSGGKPADAKTVATDAVKKVGEDIKKQAEKTVDSFKQAAIKEVEKKTDEVKKEAEKRVEEAKKKAEEEVNKKKDELLNELKKKLPW